MQVHIKYSCVQGATEKLDERISPWLPDHTSDSSTCFSEIPPAGIIIVAEGLKWLLMAVGVSKATGLSELGKGFFGELGKSGATIVKDIIWDQDNKSFAGFHKRLKQAFHGTEQVETNAEKMLTEAKACGLESGQRVYVQVGLEDGPLLRAGKSIDNLDEALDKLSLIVVAQDELSEAIDWICENWQQAERNKIGAELGEAGFTLTWQVESELFLFHDFDIFGNPVGSPREISIQDLFLNHYTGNYDS